MIRLFKALLAAVLLVAPAGAAPPFADVHVHYKWNQKEVTAPEAAIAELRQQDIAMAVVIGTPADYALQLQALAPELVVPVWSPYRTPADWSTWAHDRGVVKRARQALATGQYRGIGELHLIGGFAPHWQSPVIAGLAELAARYDVPMLVHTETASPDYMTGLCTTYPDTRFLWAHAGALLSADQVSVVMGACANLWIELSARDPWRFVNNPVTDGKGRLLPDWRRLIERWPDRVMTGTDPVWPVDVLDRWDEADSGWQQYARFVAFHRRWIGQLPDDLAQKVRLDNARAFFNPGLTRRTTGRTDPAAASGPGT